ncbi:MAG: hypothetical protein KDA27_13080, partial [Candidatus Eisenbacteria bacterium]|nr:hypothetical protein [Candidatus Eisenbacteria bacterium]
MAERPDSQLPNVPEAPADAEGQDNCVTSALAGQGRSLHNVNRMPADRKQILHSGSSPRGKPPQRFRNVTSPLGGRRQPVNNVTSAPTERGQRGSSV